MKIGVDIRVLMDKYYSGVSEYTANLLTAILRLDKENDYRLFYNSWHNLGPRLDKWGSDQATVISTRWPNKVFNYLLQKVLAYPKLDKVLGGVDIFYAPHFNFIQLTKGVKRVITVHDLSFWRYPKFFSGRKNCWHRALSVKKMLCLADKIVAVSENTKNDIIQLAGVSPEKIKVIYSGSNLIKREIGVAEATEFLSARQISGRFILYLGTIEPRKNISGLIQAFNNLKKDARFKDLKLVLAGAKGWKSRAIYQEREKSPFKNDIIFLGYISQKEKEILYSKGSVFVYPSFYEGFGFPPLEALTYGLPVVCSNVSSLPEVVGEAAILINPFKIEEITRALEMVLVDEKLQSLLQEKGYERAKFFSWNKTASEYLKLFKEL
ncbi:MAG: glycosyltransferase family 1 protein [Patescibacteria group bacterium]|jgi:glycosyltransferase involved in cell wall biosynthesis